MEQSTEKVLLTLILVASILWVNTAIVSSLTTSFGKPHVDQPYKFQLMSMYDCEEQAEHQFRFEDVRIKRYNRTQYVLNGELCAYVTLQDDWAGSVTVEYQETDNSNGRAKIAQFTTMSVCNDTLVKYHEKMVDMSQYVGNNMSTFCPIEPGCYPVKNMPFDSAAMNKAIATGYYFITINGTLGGKSIWCSTTKFKCYLD